MIKEIFDLSNQTYGRVRIAEQLKREGHDIPKKRVAKLMLINGWRSKLKK
ncbi:IS3 family transposase [Thalassobellus citreus]